MKHLVDLEHIAKYINNGNNNKEIVLDVLYEHACELHLESLIEAIEFFWQNKEKIKSNQRRIKHD